MADSEIERFQKELESLKFGNGLKSKVNDFKKTRAQKKEIRQKLEEKKEELNELIDNDSNQEEIDKLNQEIEQLNNQLKTFFFIGKFNNFKEAKAKKQDLIDEINSKEAELEKLIEEQSKLKKNVSAKKGQLTRAKKGTCKKTVKEAEDELKAAEKELADNKTAIVYLNAELEELREELDESSSNNSGIKGLVIAICVMAALIILIIVIMNCCTGSTNNIPTNGGR